MAKDTATKQDKDARLEEVKEIEAATGLDLDRWEHEIKSGFRRFSFANSDGDVEEFYIHLPTIGEEGKILAHKAKLAAEALDKPELRLSAQILKSLKDRGVWDDEKERQEQELREKLQKCLADIYLQNSRTEPDRSILEELQRERVTLELRLAVLMEPKTFWTDTTLEKWIERNLLSYQLVLLIRRPDGSSVWNSVEELENCTGSLRKLRDAIGGEAILFWSNLDPARFMVAPSVIAGGDDSEQSEQ